MPKGSRIDDKTDQLRRKVRDAAVAGVDETLAKCVREAKDITPVVTGILQGSLRFEPAKRQGDKVRGRWGSFDVNYALWVEIGSQGRAGVYMLTRTADAVYPELTGNIKRHMT